MSLCLRDVNAYSGYYTRSVDFLSNRHRWPVVLTFCASAFAILTLATVDIDGECASL